MDFYSPDHPRRFADDSAEYALSILRWAFIVICGLALGVVATVTVFLVE